MVCLVCMCVTVGCGFCRSKQPATVFPGITVSKFTIFDFVVYMVQSFINSNSQLILIVTRLTTDLFRLLNNSSSCVHKAFGQAIILFNNNITNNTILHVKIP